MGFHKDTTQVHTPFAAIYATEAAMLAATGFEIDGAGTIAPFTAYDEGKLVLVTDTGAGWVLSSHSPITWTVFSGGVTGSGVDELQWVYSTSIIDADPGTGEFRLNNADHTLATFMYVNVNNVDAFDVAAFLLAMTSLTKIYIQQSNDASRSLSYTVSGAVVDATTYVKIPITYIDSGAAVLESAASCIVHTHGGGSGYPFAVYTVDPTDTDADFSTLEDAVTGSSTTSVLLLGPGTYNVSELDIGKRTLIGMGSSETWIQNFVNTSYILQVADGAALYDLTLYLITSSATGSALFTDPTTAFNMEVYLYRCTTYVYAGTTSYLVAGTKQAQVQLYGGIHYIVGSPDGFLVETSGGLCYTYDMPTFKDVTAACTSIARGAYAVDNSIVSHGVLTSDVVVGVRSLNVPAPGAGASGIGVSHDFEASDDAGVVRKIARIIARLSSAATALVRSRLTFTMFLGADEIEVGNIEAPAVVSTAPATRGVGSVDWQSARSAASQVASGDYSTIPGGRDNTASGDHSFARGFGANAYTYGHVAEASGYFSTVGDAQHSRFTFRRIVTHSGATAVPLYLDGTAETLVLEFGTVGTFTMHVIGTDSTGATIMSYIVDGAFKYISGTTVTVLTQTITTLYEDISTYNVSFPASIAGGLFYPRVQDSAAGGQTIQWVAVVMMVTTTI